MKHYSFILGVFLAISFLYSCSQKEEDVAVSSVTISQPTAEMIVGETVKLSATVLPSNATDKEISWASSKQSVATITQDGLVTAISEGTSNITAMAGGKTGTCVVTVSKRVVAVSSIELNKTELSLVEGEDFTLVATIKPDDATDKTVTWNSSDASIASVAKGKVKALKEGTTTISAKAGEKTATCSVVVAKRIIAVTSVSLNKTELSLTKGQSETLVATIKPDDATDKTVSWSSSNTGVATVEDGKVTAVGGGEATITAKAGEFEATCHITVTVPVTSISLDKTTMTIEEGTTASLTATVQPNDASDKSVEWSSSDESVAMVENGTITAVKEGSATIMARAGDKTAECKVTVSKKVIIVTSVELNKSTLELKKGESEILSATVTPDDATDKTITWSTSEASVASVDQNGKVTALKSGTATITAKAGEKTALCSVKVTTPIESISLDRTSVSLEEGQTTTLIATITPNDADVKTVEWSSSNASVASVANGVVTAVAEGEATITAKAGEESSTCSVTVTRDTSGDAIVFEDIIAKYACVEKFDSNGDGEVSYAEAAAATSLYGLFANWNTVKSFDEIKYFTGVTSTAGVFSGLKQLKSIVLPDNITSLGDFTGCTSLESAVLPKYIGYMPDHCFENCSALKQVVLPDALNTIPRYCFQYCTSLKSIALPESLVTIGEFAFSQCSELSDIQMPPMLNTVGRYAFEDCVSITSIEFPGSLSKLGEYVMYRCSNLSLLAFSGSNLSSVPVAAFYGCNKLSHIVWPANLNSIGDKAFYGCPLSNANSDNTLTIPQSITTIGADCFVNTQHIILPSSKLISISQGAFSFGIHLYVPEDLMEMYLQRTNWKEYAPFIYSLPSYPVTPSHEEYIDLGVSVKWAWCDLESSTPGQPGLAYSWYQTDIVPAKTNNIARTPTLSECEELINECEWTAGTYMGRPGVLIVSKKEGQKRNWIFLPAGGATGINIYSERCYYWCISPKTEEGRYNALYFDPYPPTNKHIAHVRSGTVCPVRPVVDKQ